MIDILPSILDFVGVSAPEKSFLGRSVFVPGERTATLYEDGRYLLVANDMFLVAPTINDVRMFRIDDAFERTPVTTMPARQRHLETRLKATIQYFNNGMRHNQLYDPSESRVTSR